MGHGGDLRGLLNQPVEEDSASLKMPTVGAECELVKVVDQILAANQASHVHEREVDTPFRLISARPKRNSGSARRSHFQSPQATLQQCAMVSKSCPSGNG
jgi:hypothetical protein